MNENMFAFKAKFWVSRFQSILGTWEIPRLQDRCKEYFSCVETSGRSKQLGFQPSGAARSQGYQKPFRGGESALGISTF